MKTHAYQAIHWIEEYCVTPDTPDSLFFCRRAAAFAPPRFRLARTGEDYQAGQQPQHAADLANRNPDAGDPCHPITSCTTGEDRLSIGVQICPLVLPHVRMLL
jgi:hypothetical protein